MQDLAPLIALVVVLGRTFSQRNHSSVFKILWLTMLLCAVWSLLVVVKYNFYLQPWMAPVLASMYLIVSLTSASLLHFSIRLSRPLSHSTLCVVYLPPVLTLLATVTNPQLQLLLTELTIVDGKLFIDYGIWFRIHSMMCMVQGVYSIVLIYKYIREEKLSLLPLTVTVNGLLFYTLIVHVIDVVDTQIDLTIYMYTLIMLYAYCLVYLRNRGQNQMLSSFRSVTDSGNTSFLAFSAKGELIDFSSHVVNLLNTSPQALSGMRYQQVDSFINYLEPGYVQHNSKVFKVKKQQLKEGVSIVRFSDETQDYEAQKAMERLAYVDQLTGILNRKAVTRDLQNIDGALVLIDIAGIKQINDALGQSAGDIYIKQCVKLIEQACLDTSYVPYRFAGDHVCVYLAGVTAPIQAERFIKALNQHVSQKVQIGRHQFQVAISMGVVLAKPEETLDKLLQKANFALYQAKQQSNSASYFIGDDTFFAKVERAVRIDSEIEKALDNKTFTPYYQGKFDLASNQLVGAEVLARWFHDELGTVFPDEFISSLERMNIIHRLDMLILELAMVDIKRWQREQRLAPGFKLSFNCSYYTLIQPDLVAHIVALSARYQLPLGLFEVEVTESILSTDNEKLRTVLEQLTSLGLGTSIDDFSAGNSSLVSLSLLKFDTIKIDKTLIDGDDFAEKSRLILNFIRDFAKSFNYGVVLEGVETEQQVATLLELGFTTGQGYFFSRPVDCQAFEKLLKQPAHVQKRDEQKESI